MSEGVVVGRVLKHGRWGGGVTAVAEATASLTEPSVQGFKSLMTPRPRPAIDRPTLVVTDEGHIITTNPLLARYVVKITKMWRKLGAWFWIATQNLEDFPDASRKMLNMMEWWLCLVMPKEEVEQIARFKDLTDIQRSLLLSTRKEPGKYVEGVVLSDNLEALFRNVPPPLPALFPRIKVLLQRLKSLARGEVQRFFK